MDNKLDIIKLDLSGKINWLVIAKIVQVNRVIDSILYSP